MADQTGDRSVKHELGRGERVLPGVFRLRLPLPWPGVPHCNAWAVRSGDGFVLFDTGRHQPGSLEQLEWALQMCGLRLDDVKLVVCTHEHSDHYGQAASVVQRAGCELWMHPKHEHLTRMFEDPDAENARRIEIARQSGVPSEPLRRYAEQRSTGDTGVAALIEPDRPLLPGVIVETDLGGWTVHETPGHSPAHVCLFQPEHRLLISGDHLLGRISLFFDYGHSPDPVGEFLHSLDVVEALDARLCLAGHGRTFTDVHAHIDGNRTLVGERLRRARVAIGDGPCTAFEIVPFVHELELSTFNGPWLLTETLALLRHLEATGQAVQVDGERGAQRWVAH